MAAKLRPEDRTLLDLLCLAAPMAAELDRAFRLKPGYGAAIDALRNRGLVAFDSLSPSESALAAFAERQERNTLGGGSAPEAGEDVLRIPPAAPSTGEGDCAAGEAERTLATAPLPDQDPGFRSRPAKAPDWTSEEDDRLRTAYADGESLDVVAEELGRAVGGVRSRAEKIGIAGTHAAGRGGWATDPDWSDADDAVLRERYGKIPTVDLAAELGRSKGGVYNRAFALGLKHGFFRDWSAEDVRALQLADTHGVALSDLAGALGRNYSAVAKFASNHGHLFGNRPRRSPAPTVAQILELGSEEARARLDAACPPVKRVHSKRPALRPAKPAQEPKPRSRRPARFWQADRPKRTIVSWDSPSRRTAYLDALREHGRPTHALKAIGMSTGCITQVNAARKRDAAFDRQCAAVSAEWELRRQSGTSIATFARRARDLAVGLARAGGLVWDAVGRQDRFVDACRQTGAMTAALGAMGFSRDSIMAVREARKRSPDFARRVDEALAAHRQEQVRARLERPRPIRVPATSKPAPPPKIARPQPQPFERVAPAPTPPQRMRGKFEVAASGYSFDADYRIERRRKSDAEISAEALRYQQERARIAEQETPLLSLDEAKLRLQRRGLMVCRAHIVGGREDRWAVGGMGKDVTDEQLVERALRGPA